ncbi:MAG: zeta toxin family protein [Bacteroidota bacterium]
MPRSKRLRIIAGPNGSGKSTLIHILNKKVSCGTYINTDDIEKILKERKYLDLSEYLSEPATQDQFVAFMQKDTSQSMVAKAIAAGIVVDLELKENVLLIGDDTNSYEAALAGEFIKDRLLAAGEPFTFETVMSHPSKLEFMERAIAAGYKVYLYFVATESVEINISRVAQRVRKKGHAVDEGHIRSRYTNTLQLLSKTAPLTYRTYLFDNSVDNKPLEPVAEVFNGEQKEFIQYYDTIPNWVSTYVTKPLGFV